MTKREMIDDFLAQRKLALVGMSRGGRKFGNAVYKELSSKGYEIFPVHPQADLIDGRRCWPDLRSLPPDVGGLIIVVPPAQTVKMVAEAKDAGIHRVWMQQGSQSTAAVAFCEENGLSVIQRECILMHAEPVVSVHRVHRWLWRLFGMSPR